MSGDQGPHVTLPAALDFLQQQPDCHLLLVGDQSVVTPWLDADPRYPKLRESISTLHAESVVSMGEKPSVALRKRKDSSLYKAVDAVATGAAEACVSAGNTGALMAISRYRLGMHPGIDRPAIATVLPTRTGHCYMLDLGANVDCSAAHLLQFAQMGAVLAETLDQNGAPKIALLNVGEEEIKGNEQVKLASRLIQEQSQLNYIGYIEGNDIYAGKADVVVCDGFVGNIALKSSEGVARFIQSSLVAEFEKSLYRKLLGLLMRPVLKDLQDVIDPSRHNGASLLGLQGIVVKSHGAANRTCFRHAIEQAHSEAVRTLSRRINDNLASMSE